MRRFEGRNVIVTGATGGIGRAIVAAFLAEGASVLGFGSREESAAVLREALGHERLAVAALDLRDRDAIAAAAREAVAAMGRVHVLVNCAGVAFEVPVLDIRGAQWDEVIAVNLTAPFVLSQEMARHMVASGGGCIVNVSSVDAFIAESPYADYNASKAGLSMLTRSMAFELGHLGVRVTAVAPGATVTPMLEGGFEDGVYRRYMDITPAKRYATPEEQANVVLFLASDEASYVNGVTVRVDGGMLQGFWADPRLDPPLPAGPI